MLDLLQIKWQTRRRPLEPCAVAARGEVAQQVAKRLLRHNDESLAALSGVAGDGVLLLLGEAILLPWADGALYLGRDSETPSLLLPTIMVPDVPLALFERALRSRFMQSPLPLAILPQWNWVLPCGMAQNVARRQLEKFLEAPPPAA